MFRDIQRYSEAIRNAAGLNFELGDFFTKTTYLDTNKQKRVCYDVTKRGCDFIANKGSLFTAAYTTRFDEMKEALTKEKG